MPIPWLAGCVAVVVSLLFELIVGVWCNKLELVEVWVGSPQPILNGNAAGSETLEQSIGFYFLQISFLRISFLVNFNARHSVL